MSELSLRQRRTVLAICSMSLFIVGIDNTIVNVALPSIGHDFGASISGLQWTVDAYTVVIASLLMLSGSMADRFGRRRVFQLGLTLFSIGSLLCSVAPNLGWLLVFRMLQAVGGSMLNPVAMSIIRNTFTDARERAAAIGVWGAVIGISLALGPVVGGALTDSIGWRAIFWVNVPIGVAAIILTALFVPESRAPRPRRVDPVGQILVIVALATLTYGIIEGPSAGWASAQTIGMFAVSLIALVALLRYEPRRRDPLIELGFFRSAPFTGASVIAIAAFAALGGFLFLNTLYLQDVRGLSALDAGFYTLPLAAVTVIVSPISGRVVGRRGSRLPLLVGGLGIGIGSFMLTGLTPHTAVSWLLASYLIFGTGFGVVNAPITNTAVSGMPPAQAGVAAGIASTSRQIGLSLGVAVIGVTATAGVHGSLQSSLAAASHLGWWIATGCGIAVVVIGLLTTTDWANRTAVRTAETMAAREPDPVAVAATVPV
jgi:EmrB/QacA subfamily drug resistance transporter